MRILVTAFEPFADWSENSSMEALDRVEETLLGVDSADGGILFRRYPVDLPSLRSRLFADLSTGIDAVVHIGQSGVTSAIEIEAIALNVDGSSERSGRDYGEIQSGGPLAFRSQFPLQLWQSELQSLGIPSEISYHAGTYLCNAAMYLSHLWFFEAGYPGRVGFLHLPLTPNQCRERPSYGKQMSTEMAAKAIERVINLIRNQPSTSPSRV